VLVDVARLLDLEFEVTKVSKVDRYITLMIEALSNGIRIAQCQSVAYVVSFKDMADAAKAGRFIFYY
jgi:hypothetical protein